MYLSTYARLFLGFSETISSLIIHYSRAARPKQTPVLPITILSSTQIDQALSHPQNKSLKDFIGGPYADSIKADRAIIHGEENLTEQQIFIDETNKILEAKKKSASPAIKVNIENIQQTLNEQFKLFNNIKNAQAYGHVQLNDITQDFKNFSTNQDNEWSEYRDKMLEKLMEELARVLKAVGLPPLPLGEIDNLLRQDPQYVLDRFQDLGASKDLTPKELAKLLGLKPDLVTYFKMKAYLAIRSVYPSRENIAKYMQQLNSFFDESMREGTEILDRQEAKIKELDTQAQAVVQVAESNNVTLQRRKEDREHMLLKVTSINDLEAIQVKTIQRVEEAEMKPKPG